MDDYSIPELMAIYLARDLHDGEVLRVGVATPIAEAAVRLAHLTHGPNMELVFLGVRMNVAHLETIPMPARLVAIADVYDALRSQRYHKPALPHADAVRFIVEGSGGQFDPVLVKAFAACEHDFEVIFNEIRE